jgi:large subunit ribosomal protein L35
MKVFFRNFSTFAHQIQSAMPKQKTNSSAKKRFTVTGSGQIRRNKAYKSHLLTKKATKRKRNLRGTALVDKTNERMVRRLLSL